MKIGPMRILIYGLFGVSLNMYYNTYYVRHINSQLEPYMKEFMELVNKKCSTSQYKNSSYTIDFNQVKLDPDSRVVGTCYTYKYTDKFNIYIDKKYWDNANETNRFHLMGHEALHCLFDLDHSLDYNDIMYDTLNESTKEILIAQINKYLDQKCQK